MRTKRTNYNLNDKYSFIFCSFFPVGLEDYVEYFRNYFDDFYYLKWKFPHSKDKQAHSSLIYYQKGELKKEKKLSSISFSGKRFLYFFFLPLNYLQYLFQSMLLKKIPHDKKIIFMGINYYCTFCGILLKKMGVVDHVIYRVMDFFPLPPSGIYRTLNKIFYQFDKYCLKNADFLWFTTEGHIIGREKYGYFDRKKARYEIIPLGINKNKLENQEINDKNKHSLIYCGVISRYHMLDLVFEAVSELKNKFSDIKFNLIGSGPDIDYFKNLTHEMKLDDNIVFHGYMEEGEEFSKIMSNNALGIALYKDEENFMKYTEPAKVKYYLNYGVPALVSKVPQIAFELDKLRVVIATDNELKSIINNIEQFFNDDSKQIQYKKNIQHYIPTVEISNMLEEKMHKLEEELL